jgi:hypothetical protein
MRRWLVAVLVGLLTTGGSLLAVTGPSGAATHRIHLQLSPAKGLTNNQKVTISASGLGKSKHGSIVTWFASECIPKAASVRKLDPGFSHDCAVSLVHPLRVSPAGTVKTSFHVATGKVGGGLCGLPGHLSCVIAIGTAQGQHKVATITFKNITPAPTTTTTTKPPAAATTTSTT